MQPGILCGFHLSFVGTDKELCLPLQRTSNMQGVHGAQDIILQEFYSPGDDSRGNLNQNRIVNIIQKLFFCMAIIIRRQDLFTQLKWTPMSRQKRVEFKMVTDQFAAEWRCPNSYFILNSVSAIFICPFSGIIVTAKIIGKNAPHSIV